MSQLETQGRLFVEDLDRQIENIKSVGDCPTEIVLGTKARKAIIAFLGSVYGFTQDDSEDRPEFYMGIPVRMSEKSLGEWTAHASSLLDACGTVCRAGVEG